MTVRLLSPKGARQSKRMTQAEAAALTGITLDTIRKIERRSERGEAVKVARRTWERLCDAYGVQELAGIEVRA